MKIRNRWSFRRELLTMYYAFKHAGTPWYAKLSALLSVVYLLSPVDLIPDIVPFAGYIDDLVVVPFLINISTRLLPAAVQSASMEKAVRNSKKLNWILILLVLVLIGIMTTVFILATRAVEAIAAQ